LKVSKAHKSVRDPQLDIHRIVGTALLEMFFSPKVKRDAHQRQENTNNANQQQIARRDETREEVTGNRKL